jgi:RNA polymerase sigma-70 factor (ECF subfamily)
MLSLDDERQRALVASLSVPDSGPATIMASLHWSGAAHDALSLLTPLRRRLLKMSFVGDLTHEEIAAVEGLPLGTVKSHLRRSIGRLRETLQASA